MAQSASQGQSSQATQGPDKEERVYALKDCTMEVVSVGKKDPVKDEYMTIDLVFTFPDNPTPKVVGEFAFQYLWQCNWTSKKGVEKILVGGAFEVVFNF